MTLPVAILAGGLGSRLRPLTETIPKCLIEVAGRPFIVHQLELLQRKGVERAVLCLGYLGSMVEDLLGRGNGLGVQLQYVFDGSVLLGTGGALKKALPVLGDAFFVLYGDSYLDVDYAAVQAQFERSNRLGLMTVFRNHGKWDASNVLFANGQIMRYSKDSPSPEMQHIDYGLGILRSEVFSPLESHQMWDLADIYEDLAVRGQLAAFEVTRRFYEIGSPPGLEETRSYLSSLGRPECCFAQTYLSESRQIMERIDTAEIEHIAELLVEVRRQGGRIFFLGVGGGAGNCSHAVNDFRKLAGIESYAPTDNVSELTARTNDEGWETVFESWLRTSRLRPQDMVFVFSVGGGDLEHNISPNLVRALQFAREVGARIVGIVGRNGGYTAKVADACVVIPTVNPNAVTPHTESCQAVVWHLLVSHPVIKGMPTKWESVSSDVESRLCRS